MAVTEHERHEMHQGLIETMGKERAATLMAHLPPVGWADVVTKQDIESLRVATKQDIEHLRETTELRFDTVATKQDIAELRAHMDETLRKQFVTIVTCMVGLVTGMAGLLGVGATIF